MIIAKRKPVAEIVDMVKDCKRVRQLLFASATKNISMKWMSGMVSTML